VTSRKRHRDKDDDTGHQRSSLKKLYMICLHFFKVFISNLFMLRLFEYLVQQY
jgi:hypothetical protein